MTLCMYINIFNISVAHSEDEERSYLDQFTRDHIKMHRSDVKEAEVRKYNTMSIQG